MAESQTMEAMGVHEHMRGERWGEAARVLAGMAKRDASAEFQLNISRNLAAMQRWRPAVYRTLLRAQEPQRYTVGAAASGHPTIFYRSDNGSALSLSPGNQPVAALSSIFASIKQQYQAGRAMAILGIGDGYLLKSCALNPPKLTFDSQQAVYLFEPDAQAVLACMTIHDYSGPGGPIEQERFQWFVGGAYTDAARECLIGDLFNPAPVFEISQSPHGAAIGATLRGVLEELSGRYQELHAGVHAHYAGTTTEEFRAVFSEAASRPPRVLLLTTRCSSVLQYSTRDAADGFREIGWDARVLIEPARHQMITRPKVMEMLDDFKPDLIFQIDHLRSEWQNAYPPQLPFACWVQDHLPNLTNRYAGASVGSRDFVLTAMPAMYVERYGYPRRQCIDLSKLTRVPKRPASWKGDGDDLVYVSTASRQPVEVAAEMVKRFGHTAELTRLVTAGCERMIAMDEQGASMPTPQSVRVVFERVEEEIGIRLDHAELRQEVLDALFDRLGNVLYRQQSLRWAADIARRHGLKLSIYGPGWNSHAAFAAFARGTIAYGPELEELTRRSKINLVLEPFFAVSHQRLLDGLVAGGFFLVRDHPSNTLFQELLNFLRENVSEAIDAVDAARAVLLGDERAAFDDLMCRCECLTGFGDLVNLVRGAVRSGMLLARPSALPHLNEVSFSSEAELEQRITAFLADEERREDVSRGQRLDVEQRLSYAGGMKRVVQRIEYLLKTEAAVSVP